MSAIAAIAASAVALSQRTLARDLDTISATDSFREHSDSFLDGNLNTDGGADALRSNFTFGRPIS